MTSNAGSTQRSAEPRRPVTRAALVTHGIAEQIGEGWYCGNCGFQTVQGGGHSSGGTVLYAVDGSGRLRWFAHYQDHNGHNWVPVGNCGAIVGTGWM